MTGLGKQFTCQVNCEAVCRVAASLIRLQLGLLSVQCFSCPPYVYMGFLSVPTNKQVGGLDMLNCHKVYMSV